MPYAYRICAVGYFLCDFSYLAHPFQRPRLGMEKTRVWNLITLLLTGSSWLFLGMIVGVPGYCPLTDWHFSVLEKLGETNLPNSYLKYLFDRITGLDIDSSLVDRVTLIVFVVAFALSVFLNLRDKILSKRTKRKDGD